MSRDVVYKLAKNFMSRDTLLNFRKVTKYELDTCTGSRVINNFRWGWPRPPGWNRVEIIFLGRHFQVCIFALIRFTMLST